MIKIRLSKSAVAAAYAGIAAALCLGQTTTSDGGGDTWSPKWHVGDLVYSHTIQATWLIQTINYGRKTYQGRKDTPLGVSTFDIYYEDLETSDYYRPGE